jgi:hypothetical protein
MNTKPHVSTFNLPVTMEEATALREALFSYSRRLSRVADKAFSENRWDKGEGIEALQDVVMSVHETVATLIHLHENLTPKSILKNQADDWSGFAAYHKIMSNEAKVHPAEEIANLFSHCSQDFPHL